MVEWILVIGSERVVAEAYNAEDNKIYVRFSDAVEWWFGDCELATWNAFSGLLQSRDQYIEEILKFKPNGQHGS